MADPKDIKKVAEIVQSLVKAKKNLRIYPSNNPIYVKTIEITYNKLVKAFELFDELKFRMTRNEIIFEGEQVFKGTGKDDNLALFFSRDGVKEIVLQSAITLDEFRQFLEVIAFDFDREDIVDDVVTLMWEKDFQNIRYTVDENILVEEEDYEADAVEQAKGMAPTDDDLVRAYDDALRGEEVSEPSLVPVSAKDSAAVAEQVERAKLDNKSRLIAVLFEMMNQVENFFEFHELVEIIEHIIDYSVRSNDLESAVEIFNSIQEFDSSRYEDFDSKAELGRIFVFAGSHEIIKMIGETMDSETGVEEDVFESYVSFLSSDTLENFITILGELKTINARKSVINALIFLGGRNISVLAKSLGDSRWYVVRNIIYVLRKIGDPAAVNYLVKAVNHDDLRVRKEVIKTLGELGGQMAAATIMTCLDDPDVFVRTSAARALGIIGTDGAKDALLRWVMSAKFLQSDYNEKKECFEVLARWKEADVADFFMRTLRKRSLFNRARNNEMRASAAYGLGLIREKDVLPLLEKLTKSGNRILSESAYSAIKRIKYAK